MTLNHSIVVGGTRGLGRALVELWAEGTSAISVVGRKLPDASVPTLREGTQRIIDYLVSKDLFAEQSAIVVLSSVLGQFIAAEQPLGYHVAKAAQDQLVRFYAVQLASRGIRVNGVAPNLIEKESGREFYLKNPELKRHYESLIPLGHMGTPRDVANAIDFLCSDRAAHITGQILTVDGGLTVLLQHSLGARPDIRPI